MRSVRKRRRHFPTVCSWTRIHGRPASPLHAIRASQDDLASLGQRARDRRRRTCRSRYARSSELRTNGVIGRPVTFIPTALPSFTESVIL
jgi:hypothetical protein